MSETNNIELQVQGGEQPEIRLQVNGLNSKADKVDGATAGNFAGLDETGNLTDSGYKAADFATAAKVGEVPEGETVEGQISGLNANITQLADDKADRIVVDVTTPAAVMSFADGADDAAIRELVVAVEPVQDVHGLDNPYPAGGSKNLFPVTVADLKSNNTAGTWTGNSYSYGGLVFNVQTLDGISVSGIAVSGTTTAGFQFNLNSEKDMSGDFIVVGDAYLANNKCLLTVQYDTNGSSNVATHNVSISITTKLKKSYLYFWGSKEINHTFTPMIVASGVSDFTFVPYSNICPISGWTGVEVYRNGETLIPTGTNTSNGYVAGAYISRQNNVSSTSQWNISEYFLVTAGGKYLLTDSETTPSTNPAICFYNASKEFISGVRIDGLAVQEITAPEGAVYARCSDLADHANGQVKFANGDKYPITFPTPPGTVYGGTLTVNKDGTGELVVDRASVDLGTLDYTKYDVAQGTLFRAAVTGIKRLASGSDVPNILCSQYATKSNATRAEKSVSQQANSIEIDIIDSSYSDAATFKAAMSGVQLVYELATPTTYNLTAEQVGQIKSLLGVNNLWASTGNVKSVEYSADTKLYIDGKLAALLASLQ